MHPILTLIVSLLLASAAHGGVLTGAAKVAGKIAGHGTDNAVEHVVTHYGDDAAKAVAKGGGTAAVHAAPKVVKTVDAAVHAARLETRAAKPAVEAIHRAPIMKPMHVAAAGVGVAAVDAAHNLSAGEREKDRAIADSTRKTLADHPELAADVIRADRETGFWNHIGAGIGQGAVWCLALAGGLFGLAALIRSIPLRRRRRPAVVDIAPGNAGHVSAKLLLFLAFAAIALLSFRSSLRITDRLPNRHAPAAATRLRAAEPTPAPDYSAEIRRYNDAVSDALDRHLERLDKIVGDFEKGLRTKGPHRFDGVRAAIPGIRKSFSSFGAMKDVVVDGALDKAFGGDRLQNRFNAALDKPFMQPCARAGQSLVADYETFAARMAAEDAAFREELASAHGLLPKDVRVDFPIETLRTQMAQTYGALRGMPLKAGLVAAEVAIEAATARTTVRAIRNLAVRLGGKAIAKGAASAVAPAADGPLPIGDILAIGGALWTAWDIYDLVDVLPKEIENSLKGTVDSLQAQTVEAVSNAAKQTRAAHEQAARSLAASAWADQDELQVAAR